MKKNIITGKSEKFLIEYLNNPSPEVNSSLEMFAIFVPILTLITHQKNIERLIRGEENKAKFGKK